MGSENVVKSVGRVFEILELFSSVREPMNAQSICHRLNYPQSSTLVLLKSMVELGYLAFDSAVKTYFPTPRISSLGSWIFPDLLAGGDMDVKMASLNQQTRETVYLAVQKNLSMQYIKVYPGLLPIALTMTEGGSAPLFGSAVGMALLSTKSKDELDRLTDRSNGGDIQQSIDLSALEKQLALIRKQGYCSVFDSVLPGAGAIGIPLPSKLMPGNYALGIAGPTERIRDNKQQIIEAAQALFHVDE